MKIQQPSDNSLYVTIGNFVYYFDDSIEGEAIVKRWRTLYHRTDDENGDVTTLYRRTDDEDGGVTEDIQE